MSKQDYLYEQQKKQQRKSDVQWRNRRDNKRQQWNEKEWHGY